MPTLRFRVDIKMDNAAFESDCGDELAYILHELAYKLEGTDANPGPRIPLYDSNGNDVGTAEAYISYK